MSVDPPLDWWSSYFDDDYLLEHQPMFTERRNRREVARVLDVLGLPVGSKILDVPCGQGRHAKLFADAGYRVTGVDYSRALLADAKRTVPAAKFVRADMRALPASLRGKFDGVVSLGASFGFFATPADDEAAIASYASALQPGGALVLHAPNRDGIVSHFIEKDWWEADDGTMVLHERELDPLSGVLTVRRTLRRGRVSHKAAYRLRLYTATEIAAMCARHGLIVTDAFDGWRGRLLRRNTREMVLRAILQA